MHAGKGETKMSTLPGEKLYRTYSFKNSTGIDGFSQHPDRSATGTTNRYGVQGMKIQEALCNALKINESSDNILIGQHDEIYTLHQFNMCEVPLDPMDIMSEYWFVEIRR